MRSSRRPPSRAPTPPAQPSGRGRWTTPTSSRGSRRRGRCSDHKRSQDLFGRGYTAAVRRSLSFALLAACLVAGVLSAGLLVGTPSADAQEGTTTGTTTAPPPPPTTTTTTTTTENDADRASSDDDRRRRHRRRRAARRRPLSCRRDGRDQGFLRPARHAPAREDVAPGDAEAARRRRLRRRRRQARQDRQAGRERAAEGRGAAAADRALRGRARAPVRPHAGRLGALAPERRSRS